jgi:hypothetical protein
MPQEIDRNISELKQMTVHELKNYHLKLFGETPRSRHKQHLLKRIVWRLQALAEGDLSKRARLRAVELACDADSSAARYAASYAGNHAGAKLPWRDSAGQSARGGF